MARRPDIRESFSGDVQSIMRIIKAIELDDTRPGYWKNEAIEALNNAASILMKDPKR